MKKFLSLIILRTVNELSLYGLLIFMGLYLYFDVYYSPRGLLIIMLICAAAIAFVQWRNRKRKWISFVVFGTAAALIVGYTAYLYHHPPQLSREEHPSFLFYYVEEGNMAEWFMPGEEAEMCAIDILSTGDLEGQDYLYYELFYEEDTFEILAKEELARLFPPGDPVYDWDVKSMDPNSQHFYIGGTKFYLIDTKNEGAKDEDRTVAGFGIDGGEDSLVYIVVYDCKDATMTGRAILKAWFETYNDSIERPWWNR